MPLLWLSLAFLLGILLGRDFWLPFWGWIALGAVILLIQAPLTWLKRRNLGSQRWEYLWGHFPFLKPPLALWFLCTVACLGAARYQFAMPEVNRGFISFYNESDLEYHINGTLIAPPDMRDFSTHLLIDVSTLQGFGSEQPVQVRGKLLVVVWEPGVWRYGDQVSLEGKLDTPAENELFSYRDYLARQGVYSQMPAARVVVTGHGGGNFFLRGVYAFKARALELVYSYWPDPEASLLAGILLGVESGIPPDVDEAFVATGTSHIIAISGQNS